ncbi:amidohydrolase 2 [Decorospora gaudefroyi]|uniref:Amidohydrolase 2 n=1 Tax=Decorospora gaudefroyi TaxID=184978 RepID=A0A6A5K6Y9_9PLEO|nr:amidohydrolase 2 [Decorospora gaudefroyi]
MAISHTANLIATLESYLTPTIAFTSPPTSPTQPALHLIPAPTVTKLRNLATGRVKDMRALGQSKQIISHIPIAAPPQPCSKYNDAIQAAIVMGGEKFAAMALLPTEGKEAAKELARCVGKYRFVGGVLGLNRDVRLDDNGYEELWVTAEKYRIPVVLREMWPLVSDTAEYQHNLPPSVLAPLLTQLHTGHTTSPLPFVHLYLSSVFDRHPSLRLILAHPGSLPSLIPRIETLLTAIPVADRPKRSFLDVWQHNIYLTTADAQDISTLRTLLEQIPVDRVLYASNYPLEERGKELMEELRESEFLTKMEWERVAWENAETLFNLKGASGKGVR